MAKNRIRLGKLPPRYRFALSQYSEARWSKCPKCGKLTYMRKFPLLIHIDGFGLLNLACRYCAKCEFIIAHQDDLEHILTEIFSESYPDIVGNEYLVIGTVKRNAWQKAMLDPIKPEEIWDHTAVIKEYLFLRYEPGGCLPPDPNASGTPRKAHIRPRRR